MGVAADDTVIITPHILSKFFFTKNCLLQTMTSFLSSCGALGTGKCKGLILINTSGPILSKDGVPVLKQIDGAVINPYIAVQIRNGLLEECR